MNISNLLVRITGQSLCTCERNADLFRTIFIGAALLMFAVSFSFFFGANDKAPDASKLDRFLVAVILLLPVVQIVVILCVRSSLLRGLFAVIMLLSLIGYHWAWVSFSLEKYGLYDWIAYTSIAAILVMLSLGVTWLMMRPPGFRSAEDGHAPVEPILDRLQDDIGQHAFHTICFFLTLFLAVTFTMSFAFALEDKHEQAKGKWSLCIAPTPPEDLGNVGGDAKGQGKEDDAEPVLLLFESGRADVRIKKPTEISGNDANDVMMVKNDDAVSKLGKTVSDLMRNGGKVRIVLAGHADSKDVVSSGRFKSNFELSDARARAAHLYLRGKLGKSIAEWAVFPLADEEIFSRGKLPAQGSRRSVEVWAESVELPEARASRRGFECSANTRLNDYLYFTIYTVTTTGFGDIRPVSAKAKFMTSACNLYELFFVVVFFNVLIASRRQHDPEYRLLLAEITKLREFIGSPGGPLN